MWRILTSGAFALILGGCASNGMDQAQCHTADWRAVGYEDGSKGLGGTAIGGHRKNCAAHGVTPNFASYMDGHGQGIAEFCRPQNGYRLGTRGYRYGGICPAKLEGVFLEAHADGLGLYQCRVTVSRLNRQITRKHRRSKKIERLMAQKTTALVSYKTPPSQRLHIGVELKQLTEERINIERSISDLHIDLERAQQDYDGYRDSLAQR
jgi:hypothetical protein